MDVFKTTVGDNRAWPISQESYYMHTGGLRPFVAGGDGHFTYYAVCPACDNPIQLVGLNRMEQDAKPLRPYGRHVRKDVPGVALYDEDAYLSCPYSDPGYDRPSGLRRPSDPTSLALYELMRDRFDRIEYAWRLSSGIWLGGKPLRTALRGWRENKAWLNYGSTYCNLPQMLLLGHPEQSLYGQCVRNGGQVSELLRQADGVRLEPVSFTRGYMKVTTTRFVAATFTVGVPKAQVIDQHLTWTFLMGINVDGRQLGRVPVSTDPEWFSNIIDRPDWHDNQRLLDLARDVLGD